MTSRAWAAFGTVAILWGLPYFFIKVAVGEVSPSVVAWSRLACCFVLLLPLALRRASVRGVWRRWPWVVLLGIEYLALPFVLIPTGETFISSSLTAIIIAGVPLTVALLSLPFERPSPLRVVGLAVGLIGVGVLVGLDVGGRPAELIGAGCIILVTVFYAIGPIVTARRLAGVDPISTTAIASGIGMLALTPPMLVTRPDHLPSTGVVGALLGLGILCTAVALAAYFFLIAEAGAGRASLVTYINPAIAVLAGVLLLHERITLVSVAGMFLILLGSWLALTARAMTRPAPAAEVTPAGGAD
jgi:drug/metabolite transporter (DMT)-like permease